MSSDFGPPPDDGPPLGGEGRLTMPNATDTEREVLAAILIDPQVMDSVLEHLTSEDFYHEKHALLFEQMTALHERAASIDPVTLRDALANTGNLERVGGVRAISELMDRVGVAGHVEHYCRIVSRKAMLRKMIHAARGIEAAGLSQVEDVDEFLDQAERQVFQVLEDRTNTSLRPINEVVAAAIEQITAAYESDGNITGVGTGFRDFDKITNGLQGGDLIIIAARPAMGKTSFVLNLGSNAALKHGAAVAIFSLEMPAEQLAGRLISAEARIDLSRLRGGYVRKEEWPRLTEAADRVSQAKIFIDDTPGVTPAAVRAKCRRLKRQHNLGLVLIDYLQLMSGGGKQNSREQEISHISRSLKGLAKDISVPVIALSQLNRGVESRADKRPMMSDLRESGAIEQDADMICFIYRDEVYNPDVDESEKGIAELIIGKHRNGPTGTVKLKFWNQYTRFDNLALDHQLPQ